MDENDQIPMTNDQCEPFGSIYYEQQLEELLRLTEAEWVRLHLGDYIHPVIRNLRKLPIPQNNDHNPFGGHDYENDDPDNHSKDALIYGRWKK